MKKKPLFAILIAPPILLMKLRQYRYVLHVDFLRTYKYVLIGRLTTS